MKFYFYQGQGPEGQRWKGEYQYTAKQAKDQAREEGMPSGTEIVEVKITDKVSTMKNLLNQNQEIFGSINVISTIK
tara:strand:- start:380 stop:607 length:228 start_codon:yes stop_codon:yes gene_type:complete